ncbi:MAG: hypothetical protein K2P66_14105 [Lachnospiraceae bacterium]|nr:hypothetical protein [Lachnospiraceae bacterium]
MKEKGKDNLWTVEKIAEVFQKDSCKKKGCGEEIRGKMTPLYIRNRIKEILKEIDCPESIFRSKAKKQDGHFIFKGDDSVPDKICRIIEFYDLHHDQICDSFMSDEENILLGMLLEVRPFLRREPCNNTYMEHRKELNDFYVNKYLKIYKHKLFLKVNVENGKPSKFVRSNIYCYQKFLVEEWHEKWSFMMKTAMYLRINERIFNGYRCGLRTSLIKEEDRKKFYLQGYWFEQLEDYLKKDRLNEEEIYDTCNNLYYYESKEVLKKVEKMKSETITYQKCYAECMVYVKKILSSPLLDASIDDYLYMLRKAKEELEDLYIDLKNELEIEKEYDEIIYGLRQIREIINEEQQKGNKNKKIEKILDESIRRIDQPEMSDNVNGICKEIKKIVENGKTNYAVQNEVIDYCNKKIKEYHDQMEIGESQGLAYNDYEKILEKEMEKIGIDKQKFGEGKRERDYLEVFVRARIKHIELKKREMLIIDFLPEDERETYWSIREFYTGRKLV